MLRVLSPAPEWKQALMPLYEYQLVIDARVLSSETEKTERIEEDSVTLAGAPSVNAFAHLELQEIEAGMKRLDELGLLTTTTTADGEEGLVLSDRGQQLAYQQIVQQQQYRITILVGLILVLILLGFAL